ncbi:hypothetical protein ACSTS3_10675 [Aquimarina muelleri]|uniref:hypothetical protein n=1 Tax=Aquimarina muelleri TaxID=279356 RepID=UPI003F686545
MKKSRYALLLALVFIVNSCKSNNEKQEVHLQNTKEYNIKEKKRYYLDYYIPGVVYADLFINDIKIDFGAEGNGYEELNPYILNSRECTIKIKMYHINKTPRMVEPELLVPQDEHGTGGALRVRIYTSDENEKISKNS